MAFSAGVERNLHQLYGSDEAAVLRAAILDSVSKELGGAALPKGAVVAVTVQDLAPTRLTRQQQRADPSLDPVHSKSVGGAALVGIVSDPLGHEVLMTVTHRYFTPTLHEGSQQRDPWADARRAIEGFAAKLGNACRNRPPRV